MQKERFKERKNERVMKIDSKDTNAKTTDLDEPSKEKHPLRRVRHVGLEYFHETLLNEDVAALLKVGKETEFITQS